MAQQQSVADKIKKSYPYIDMVFGTQVFHRLPEFIYNRLSGSPRLFELTLDNADIVEDIPVSRDGEFKGWLPIMYGCKFLNFTRASSEYDFIARRIILELEGEEGEKHIDEYADASTERGRKLRDTICKKMNFTSLEFQSLDGIIKAIGLPKCKLCTYCWNGKE